MKIDQDDFTNDQDNFLGFFWKQRLESDDHFIAEHPDGYDVAILYDDIHAAIRTYMSQNHEDLYDDGDEVIDIDKHSEVAEEYMKALGLV